MSLRVVSGNLANTYQSLGRDQEALRLRQDVYSGYVILLGEAHRETILEANNYAATLVELRRYEEARSLMRQTIPVARRALGERHRLTLKMRWNYARALYFDTGATLDDLREAVTTLEDATTIARRVLGGGNPLTLDIELSLRNSRATLRARETPPPGSA